MARIATKTGDKGDTGLANGQRVPKSSLRVQAYGDVDELNALLGIMVTSSPPGAMRDALSRVQRELFDLGADLALAKGGPRITKEHVARLDKELDELEAQLPLLKHFILPGGHIGAAYLHLARTVCRRAERSLVAVSQQEPVDPTSVVYLNRLSDWLFLWARAQNKATGTPDVEWHST
jgi:cob(I)alamin adenosyltransferase